MEPQTTQGMQEYRCRIECGESNRDDAMKQSQTRRRINHRKLKMHKKYRWLRNEKCEMGEAAASGTR